MEFQPTRLADYSRRSLIDEIRRVYRGLNSAKMSKKDFCARSMVGMTTIRRKFGGWKEALEVAGLLEAYINGPVSSKSSVTSRQMSDEEVIKEIQRVASALGVTGLSVAAFKEHSHLGPGVVRGRFGTWGKGLEKAGLRPVEHGKRYSDADCYDNLMAVWLHVGRQPYYRDMSSSPSKVGGKAYVTRWGSWTKAVHAFVQYATDCSGEGSVNSEESTTTDTKKKVSRKCPSERRDPSAGLKYKVLMRDSCRCVLCGRSPSSDIGCKLHIDHIVPFSRGGKSRATR